MKFTQVVESDTYNRWESKDKLYTIAWYTFIDTNIGYEEFPHYSCYYKSDIWRKSNNIKTFEECIALCKQHNQLEEPI